MTPSCSACVKPLVLKISASVMPLALDPDLL
jgi:hypothetical protein